MAPRGRCATSEDEAVHVTDANSGANETAGSLEEAAPEPMRSCCGPMCPNAKPQAILHTRKISPQPCNRCDRPLSLDGGVLGSFSAKPGLVIVAPEGVVLIQVTTCLPATAATHRNRRHGKPLPRASRLRADSAIAASLQSHWSGTLDDLPARIRAPFSVQGAYRGASRGLGGSGSAAMAGGEDRAASGGWATKYRSGH